MSACRLVSMSIRVRDMRRHPEATALSNTGCESLPILFTANMPSRR
jgi:hypothetical protein